MLEWHARHRTGHHGWSCRQPEFSQLDMEMTFMDQDAIMALTEQLVATIFSRVGFQHYGIFP